MCWKGATFKGEARLLALSDDGVVSINTASTSWPAVTSMSFLDDCRMDAIATNLVRVDP